MKGMVTLLAGASVLMSAAEPAPPGFRLPSGLEVLVHPDAHRPLVRITLRLELPPGLAEADLRLLGAALARGGAGPHAGSSSRRPGRGEGHAWTFEARGTALIWSVLADSQDQEGAAELLAHAVIRPDLAGGWRELQAEAVEPAGGDAFRSGWTGEPAGWMAPEGATLGRLLALGRALLRPERATLRFQGDATLPQARQLALLQFGTWRPGPADPLPDPVPRLAGSRILLAPGPEGRALHAGFCLPPAPEGLQAAAEVLLAHRLAGLFDRSGGQLVHARALQPAEDFPQVLRALLAEIDRRLAAPPGAEDLRILQEERATATLRQRLEPSRAFKAPPDLLSLERIAPLLAPAVVRERLRVLLEGAGPEDQTALAALGLGPVQRFNR